MANRFLETNYYKSPFVRGLKGALKGLYSFIICDCTPSGIWSLDMEAASLYIGFPVTMAEFQEHFIKSNKSISIGNGKYFFPDFIEHQYPSGLQSWNKSHNKIILELNNYGFLREEKNTKLIPEKFKPDGVIYFVNNKGALKGLPSPQGNGNGQGIGNGEGNGLGQYDPINEKLLVPQMFGIFKKYLTKYPSFIEKDFKPLKTIADFLHTQSGLNGNILLNQTVILAEWEKLCTTIANDKFYKSKTLSTISNQIQEIFQISKNGNSNSAGVGKTLLTGNIGQDSFGKL